GHVGTCAAGDRKVEGCPTCRLAGASLRDDVDVARDVRAVRYGDGCRAGIGRCGCDARITIRLGAIDREAVHVAGDRGADGVLARRDVVEHGGTGTGSVFLHGGFGLVDALAGDMDVHACRAVVVARV